MFLFQPRMIQFWYPKIFEFCLVDQSLLVEKNYGTGTSTEQRPIPRHTVADNHLTNWSPPPPKKKWQHIFVM
jgi:hypothetical protein